MFSCNSSQYWTGDRIHRTAAIDNSTVIYIWGSAIRQGSHESESERDNSKRGHRESKRSKRINQYQHLHNRIQYDIANPDRYPANANKERATVTLIGAENWVFSSAKQQNMMYKVLVSKLTKKWVHKLHRINPVRIDSR